MCRNPAQNLMPGDAANRELTRNTDSLMLIRAIVYARGMPDLEDL